MKPELLAPAGSLEAFHAAVGAGADAVYLGLDRFNARLRAGNFTVKTLAYLVPYARGRGVKVHVTLNTLVKQQELPALLDTLYQLEQIGPDAVIVQDVGVAALAAKWFPGLTLHGSTQMAVHNAPGVAVARRLGLRRVILARELSIEEIESVSREATVELEVFVHGALCYSISGLCLASSFMGGMSGNRGRCTQVCRRRFESPAGSGFYFSCRDYCGIDYLEDYRRLGIASLKIEGRMRSAEYVHTVVSAYRKALDDPSRTREAGDELRADFGRPKTTLFLTGRQSPELIEPHRPAGTGRELGRVRETRRDWVVLDTQGNVGIGDRVRFHSPDGTEGRSAKVLAVESSRTGKLKIRVPEGGRCHAGDLVCLTATHGGVPPESRKRRIDIHPVRFRETAPRARRIISRLNPRGNHRGRTAKPRLYLRVDSLRWLRLIGASPCDGVVLGAERSELDKLLQDRALLGPVRDRLAIALPPFIGERDLDSWRDTIGALRKAGVRHWVCGHAGQIELLGKDDGVCADTTVWCLNRAARKALADMGFVSVSASPEDDMRNIRSWADPRCFFTLFAMVPLFVSRITPPLPAHAELSDPRGEPFFVERRHGLHYTVAARPLCLTHRRDILLRTGIHRFILDFSFLTPHRKLLKSVLDHYHKSAKLPGTTVFNHKAGLR
jgi:putative protease